MPTRHAFRSDRLGCRSDPVLRSDDHHGRTYTLTGPELLGVADQAAVLSGRPAGTYAAWARDRYPRS
ncbi:hypothetical protein ACRAKI_31555 [Saccharothrix isguenensis]